MNVFKKVAPLFMCVLMVISMVACSNNKSTEESGAQESNAEKFPQFVGVDFDGNTVDDSLLKENAVTILNFWFNGCSACVNEMPALEEFNKELQEKGCELIGVNVETVNNDKALKEAKNILDTQGATYRNISITGDKEVNSYVSKIMAFPTTILVDSNGKIIGKPITGNIDEKDTLEKIMKMVDDSIAGRDISSDEVIGEGENNFENNSEVSALFAKENEILDANKELWDKVFENYSSDEATDSTKELPYVDLLKSRVESTKSLFTDDELKTLYDDISKVEIIEQQISELMKGE